MQTAPATPRTAPVGHLIRHWRQRRRWSQLALACEAEISARHLSFLETGRSQPSREMVLRLADQLDVPLRERNVLLVSAGFAPTFRERALDDPNLAQARAAIERVLLVTANAPAQALLSGIDAALLAPPLNVLRASLHPGGLASRSVNFSEWRAHRLHRLRRQVEASGVVVPLQLRSPLGTLSFLSTTMVFGTAVDITLSERVLESFFPADAATAQALARLAAGSPS